MKPLKDVIIGAKEVSWVEYSPTLNRITQVRFAEISSYAAEAERAEYSKPI